MTQTLLCIGYGYCAQVLGPQAMAQGMKVIGTTRRFDGLAPIARMGVTALQWPSSDLRTYIARATHILISVAPDAAGDPFFRDYGAVIAEHAMRLKWVGYLSTTGVYGDHAGGWVDESTPLAPSTERGRLRVLAERQWQSIPKLPLNIFRLAGIYGPGRGPFEKVRNGTARRIIKEGQVFSRTHVEDIAQVVMAAMERPDAAPIYNVCDDDPAPPEDVIAYAAELLGLPIPPEVPYDQADMTPMARSFYAESKRVKNDLIKDRLGVQLRYPDYRSGLRAILAAGGTT